jgi:hypothetical protein
MTLITHAEHELKAIGMLGSGDEMNEAMSADILELLRTFSEQGHSGFSASYAINLFEKLARFEPLGPLTGEDAEWHDVSEASGEPMWQNKRCSHVFKAGDGRAYDIDAVVYREPNGAQFTRGGARHYIEFPYTPKREIVKVDFNGVRVSDEQFAELEKQYAAENPNDA